MITFPKVDFKGVKFSKGVYYNCKIVDEVEATMKCDATPHPIAELPDGGFYLSIGDAKKIRNSYKDARKKFDSLPIYCKAQMEN